MVTNEAAPALQVSRLMDGYLLTQLLHTAASPGVADMLAGGPQGSEAIALAVGAEPHALHRVLRGLAGEGLLEEDGDGRFRLTPLGDCLRRDAPGSLHGAILARGGLYYGAAAGLLDAVRDGGVPFERAYGAELFGYLAGHPDEERAFQRSMADRSRQEVEAVLAAYDFGALGDGLLVDVGGGTGTLLEAILAAAPHLRGLLFDRPETLAGARERLLATSVAARCELVGGDVRDAVPTGGDVYLLSRVVHDFDDEAVHRILSRCHEAMAPGATLLIVEAILPELAREQPAAIRMDLNMLMLLGGRERTEVEFERLLRDAGFEPQRAVPTGSPTGIGVLEARQAA
jgi:precorrin-6B methylase 2